MTIASLVTLHFLGKIIDKAVADSSMNWFKKIFFFKKTYEVELANIVDHTIIQYEKTRLVIDDEGFRFYQSEILFEKLMRYLLFKEDSYCPNQSDFDSNPNIKRPTQEEINEFFGLFMQNIDKNKKLKKLFISENYQEEIFYQTSLLKSVLGESEKVKKQLDDMNALIKLGFDNRFSNTPVISDSYVPQGLTPYTGVKNSTNREEVVSKIETLLKDHKWVSLLGNISMGKTQLAILVGKRKANTLWIDLKGIDGNQIYRVIIEELRNEYAKNEIDKTPKELIDLMPDEVVIVLDDVPKLSLTTKNIQQLSSFLTLIGETRNILSTSNFPFPISFKESLDDFIEYPVPFLSNAEVEEVAMAYGASDAEKKILAPIIEKLSKGHPAIVALICRYLREKQWKPNLDSLNELFKGDFAGEFDIEVNERLITTISEISTRELLYRMKLILGNISNNEVTIVAGIKPEIKLPHEKLLQLEGIWLQSIKVGYELSPLVKRLRSNLPIELTKAINIQLGEQIIANKTLNQIQAYKAILYFDRAGQFDKAGQFLAIVLNSAYNNPQLYFDWGFDSLWTNAPLPIEMDTFLRLTIRFMQINLFKLYNKDIDFLIQDLEAIVNEGVAENVNVAPGTFQLTMYYSDKDPLKANQYLAQTFGQMNSLKYEGWMDDLSQLDLNIEMLIWNNLLGVDTIESFEKWLITYCKFTQEQREASTRGDLHYVTSMIAMTKIFDKEISKPHADFEFLIYSYDEIIKNLADFGDIFLLPFAFKFKIRCQIRADKSSARAAITLQEAEDLFDLFQEGLFIVRDEFGRELLAISEKELALPVLLKALAVNSHPLSTDRIYTCLAISEILLEIEPQKSLKYATQAYQLQKGNKYIDDISSAKILGEYSTIQWILGFNKEAFSTISEGLEKILNTYRPEEEYKATIIRYGHCVNYYFHVYSGLPVPKTGGENYMEPFFGMYFRSNEKLLDGGFYFDTRKFMQAIIMVHCFEVLNDCENAAKWMKMVIRFDQEEADNPFRSVLMNLHAYKIIEGKYVEAIENGKNILISMSKKKDYTGLNPILRNLLESNKRPQIDFEDNFDVYFFEYILNFIIVDALRNYINSQTDEIINNLQMQLEEISSYFAEPKLLDFLKTALEYLKSKEKTIQDIENIEIGSGDFAIQQRLILYLIASMKSSTFEAFKYHFALIGRLEYISHKVAGTGNYRFIVIPFMLDFWKRRIDEDAGSFQEYSFLRNKGIQKFENAEPLEQMRKLFKVLQYHLDFEANEEQEKWLESELRS